MEEVEEVTGVVRRVVARGRSGSEGRDFSVGGSGALVDARLVEREGGAMEGSEGEMGMGEEDE